MLTEKIRSELNKSMKAKDTLRVSTLRLVLAGIENKVIELRGKGEELTDEHVLGVIQKEVKKRREASELYTQGGREELAEKERLEEKVLNEYLPEELSDDSLAKIVEEAITSTGAASLADIGKVMGALMPKVKGRADGGKVNKLVKEKLQ